MDMQFEPPRLLHQIFIAFSSQPTENGLNCDEHHQRVSASKTIRDPAGEHGPDSGANKEAHFHVAGDVAAANQAEFLHQCLGLAIAVGELEKATLCVVQIAHIAGPIDQLAVHIGHATVVDIEQLATVCGLAEIAPLRHVQLLQMRGTSAPEILPGGLHREWGDKERSS